MGPNVYREKVVIAHAHTLNCAKKMANDIVDLVSLDRTARV